MYFIYIWIWSTHVSSWGFANIGHLKTACSLTDLAGHVFKLHLYADCRLHKSVTPEINAQDA